MLKVLKLGVVLLVLSFSSTACVVTRPTATPTAALLPSNPQATSVAPTAFSPVRPTQVAAPATATVTVSANDGALTLQILSPQDEAVVNTSKIDVVGLTSPKAIVSVNDNVLVAEADGRFQSSISLEQGPNLIEIIASDDAGNEVSIELTVTYEP